MERDIRDSTFDPLAGLFSTFDSGTLRDLVPGLVLQDRVRFTVMRGFGGVDGGNPRFSHLCKQARSDSFATNVVGLYLHWLSYRSRFAQSLDLVPGLMASNGWKLVHKDQEPPISMTERFFQFPFLDAGYSQIYEPDGSSYLELVFRVGMKRGTCTPLVEIHVNTFGLGDPEWILYNSMEDLLKADSSESLSSDQSLFQFVSKSRDVSSAIEALSRALHGLEQLTVESILETYSGGGPGY